MARDLGRASMRSAAATRSGRGRAASPGRCAAPGGRRRRRGCAAAMSARWARGGLGVALARAASLRSGPRGRRRSRGRPGSSTPTSGSSSSRGSMISMASDLVAGRDQAQRAAPSRSGARKSEMTTARPRRRASPTPGVDGRRPGRHRARRRRRAAVEHAVQEGHAGVRPTAAGRDRVVSRCPSAVSAPKRLPVRAVRKPTAAVAASGEVALLAVGGAEVEAGASGRRSDPGLELAVGDGLADVGVLGAGGDVPVDAADVVAGLVGPGLAGLGAVAGDEAAVVALEHAVEAAGDVELEAAQHLGGGRPRDRRGRRVCAGRRLIAARRSALGGRVGRPAASWPGSGRSGSCEGAIRGAGTVDRSRARIWSAVEALGQRLVGRAPGGGAGRRGRRRRRPGAARSCGPAAGPAPGRPATRPRLARGLAP